MICSSRRFTNLLLAYPRPGEAMRTRTCAKCVFVNLHRASKGSSPLEATNFHQLSQQDLASTRRLSGREHLPLIAARLLPILVTWQQHIVKLQVFGAALQIGQEPWSCEVVPPWTVAARTLAPQRIQDCVQLVVHPPENACENPSHQVRFRCDRRCTWVVVKIMVPPWVLSKRRRHLGDPKGDHNF